MASPARISPLEGAFGAVLRGRRAAEGLSQEELGERSGIHRTYISALERGRKHPSLGTVERLAEALGMQASALVAEAEARVNRAR